MSGFKTLFSSGSEVDEQDTFEKLEELRDQVEIARTHLMNSEETEFIAVTIPTIMAIWETERLIRALYDVAFPIKQIFINQVQPDNPSCSYCKTRFLEHQKNLVKIHDLYADFNLLEIPSFEHEIRGIGRLRELANLIYGQKED